MASPPKTHYAKSGDVHIAYQVVGDGPLDLVLVHGFVTHLECMWEWPPFSRFQERLGSFCRLLVFDKRGTGLSDRVGVKELPTLEQRMDDVRAVMNAVESKRAALLGVSEGGAMSILFAATYPERVSHLILYGTFARYLRAWDYPCGIAADILEQQLQSLETSWGEGNIGDFAAPSLKGEERDRYKQWWARVERMGASPGSATAMLRMAADTDVRSLLSAIHVPCLVLHRTTDLLVNPENGRFLGQRVADAKLVMLAGDHAPWVEPDAIVDEVEEFLTGTRHAIEADRVLATVLFTDIVASTERAAVLGDKRWRELLAEFYAIVRRELERHRGKEVSTAGDSFLATFDGPARAIRCACTIRDSVRALSIQVRSGLHTGECELIGDNVGGIAVHTGARVGAMAGPGEVLVLGTVRDLVAGSGIKFADRGAHGVPGEWHLFAAEA